MASEFPFLYIKWWWKDDSKCFSWIDLVNQVKVVIVCECWTDVLILRPFDSKWILVGWLNATESSLPLYLWMSCDSSLEKSIVKNVKDVKGSLTIWWKHWVWVLSKEKKEGQSQQQQERQTQKGEEGKKEERQEEQRQRQVPPGLRLWWWEQWHYTLALWLHPLRKTHWWQWQSLA